MTKTCESTYQNRAIIARTTTHLSKPATIRSNPIQRFFIARNIFCVQMFVFGMSTLSCWKLFRVVCAQCVASVVVAGSNCYCAVALSLLQCCCVLYTVALESRWSDDVMKWFASIKCYLRRRRRESCPDPLPRGCELWARPEGIGWLWVQCLLTGLVSLGQLLGQLGTVAKLW